MLKQQLWDFYTMNEKLQKKLSQTYQRRKLRESIALLPQNLQATINLEDIVYKDEVYSRHGLPIYPKNIDGEWVYPTGYSLYQYQETDEILKLPTYLSGLKKFDSSCLISLDTESGFFRLDLQYIDDFLKFYSSSLLNHNSYLALFQSDYTKGVIIDSYCGYLPEHLSTNKNEVVYEFLYWEKNENVGHEK